MTDTSEWTPIRIESPLPLNVAGALMQMIGTAWPDAVIEPSPRHALHMRIPHGPAEDLDAEFLAQLTKNADPDTEGQFLGFRDGGYLAFTPPEELCLDLGHVAHAIFTAHKPQAINHVEWEVVTGHEPDDARYVLSISVAKDRTPLAMRKQAEAEVERLTALLEKHGIDPKEQA